MQDGGRGLLAKPELLLKLKLQIEKLQLDAKEFHQ